MVKVIWTEPALAELDAIADHIALDKPSAASRLVQRIFSSPEQLTNFPALGSRIPEVPKSSYRQLVVKPCRIFYRREKDHVFIVFVMRGEKLFQREFLE